MQIGDWLTINKTTFSISGMQPQKGLIGLSNLTKIWKTRKAAKPVVFKLASIELQLKKQEAKIIPRPLDSFDVDGRKKVIKEKKKKFISEAKDIPIMLATSEQRTDAKYALIERFVTNEHLLQGYIFGPSEAGRYISENGLDKNQFYLTLNRYLAFGCNKSALNDRYHLSGSRQKTEPKKKVGRRLSEFSVAAGVVEHKAADPKEKQLIRETVEKYKFRPFTIGGLYQKYIDDNYVERQVDFVSESGHITYYKKADPSQYISEAAFRYHFDQLFPKAEVLKWKIGMINFQKDVEDASSGSKAGISYATQQYQVDSTSTDIDILVDSTGYRRMAGRATLYLIKDTYSSACVGYFLSFLDESGVTVREAFVSAFTEKSELFEKFKMPYKAEDWPCNHVCRSVLMDRGSEYGIRLIQDNLKTVGAGKCAYARPRMGKDKGVIERGLGIIHSRALEGARGVILKKRNHNQLSPSKRTQMTLFELHRNIIDEIVRYNNHTYFDVIPDLELVLKGKSATPIELYKRSLAKIGSLAITVDKDAVRVALMPRADANLTNEGFYANGFQYVSSDPEISLLMTEASPFINNSRKVEVLYHDADVEFVWFKVQNDQGSRLVRLSLHSNYAAFKGIPLNEALKIKKEIAADKRMKDQKERAERLNQRQRERNQKINSGGSVDLKNSRTTKGEEKSNEIKELGQFQLNAVKQVNSQVMVDLNQDLDVELSLEDIQTAFYNDGKIR